MYVIMYILSDERAIVCNSGGGIDRFHNLITDILEVIHHLIVKMRNYWRSTAMRKKKSAILEAVHETAKGLHQAGVMDRVTMREFVRIASPLANRLCLPPIEPLTPEKIKQIREEANVSQAVFAALLNTSISTVQKWEIGQKQPTGTALKLLHLVRSHGIDLLTISNT